MTYSVEALAASILLLAFVAMIAIAGSVGVRP